MALSIIIHWQKSNASSVENITSVKLSSHQRTGFYFKDSSHKAGPVGEKTKVCWGDQCFTSIKYCMDPCSHSPVLAKQHFYNKKQGKVTPLTGFLKFFRNESLLSNIKIHSVCSEAVIHSLSVYSLALWTYKYLHILLYTKRVLSLVYSTLVENLGKKQ